MRFYTETHQHDCGIDLNARTMYLCSLDPESQVLLHRNLPRDPERFIRAVGPYREGLVVAVECIFTWYRLADLCAREDVAFVLGHALYMRAIHGASGARSGNAHLTLAFSEAPVLFLAKCPEAKKLMARLEPRQGKGKALSILAHRTGRAAYFMLKRRRAFDLDRFLRMQPEERG